MMMISSKKNQEEKNGSIGTQAQRTINKIVFKDNQYPFNHGLIQVDILLIIEYYLLIKSSIEFPFKNSIQKFQELTSRNVQERDFQMPPPFFILDAHRFRSDDLQCI